MRFTVSVVIEARRRAERRRDQICSEIQYQKSFERLKQLPCTVEHLVVQLGMLISSILTVMTIRELGQGFLSRTLGWFFWRTYSTQSSTLWST